MWLISWRDLQWRRRRFTIALAGTALIFAMTLLLSGLSDSLHHEPFATVRAVGADRWVVPSGVASPLTGLAVFPESTLEAVRAAPGVRRAAPLAFVRQTVVIHGHSAGAAGAPPRRDVNVVGYQLGAMGAPPVRRGRAPARDGEAAIDATLHAHVGDTLVLAGRPLRVVGVTDGLRLNAGVPNLYATIDDVQAAVFGGRAVVGAIVTKGVPGRLPSGLRALRNHAVAVDELRLLHQALNTIDMVRDLMWLVAAALVGSVVYLSALERVRDFAVCKAVGATTRTLVASLGVQSVLVTGAAAAVGAVASRLLAPMFPLPTSVPSGALRLLPVTAVGVGVLASLAGVRRSAAADPALAFSAP